MKTPKKVDLSEEDYEKLQERLKKRELQDSDYELISGALQFIMWLQFSLKEAKISIGRLSKLFGFTTKRRKRRGSPKDYQQSVSPGDDESEPGPSSEEEEPSGDEESRQSLPKKKGHGRKPHTAYTGAPTIEVSHRDLKVGDPCPLDCGGWLYAVAPGILIRVTGSPIAAATRYQLEKLRCSLCGEYFTASLPAGVNPDERYDAEAKAAVVIQKYFMGSPFHRMSAFQSLVGMPLPEATAWQLCEESGDVGYPIYRELIVQGAQGGVLHNDDTTIKILSLMKENQQDPPPERKSMYTSGILSKTRLPEGTERKIVIFISGRDHAGSNLDFGGPPQRLKHRAKDLGKAIQMSDALSSSQTKESETLACSCMAHAFRKFEDVIDYWPQDCHFVMKRISQVYQFDEKAEELELSPQQRLEFHQRHSQPLMEELKAWLDDQKEAPLFDPGSSLGKAIQYMLNHWEKLIGFLEIPSAPLDNNELERGLKVPKRNQKNAYFYKTEHGALIGDIHMSIIYTCWLNEVNPFDYMVQLHHYRSEVLKAPQRFLPWNYQETLALLEQQSA